VGLFSLLPFIPAKEPLGSSDTIIKRLQTEGVIVGETLVLDKCLMLGEVGRDFTILGCTIKVPKMPGTAAIDATGTTSRDLIADCRLVFKEDSYQHSV